MAEKKVIDIQINSNAKNVTADINNAAQATTNLGNASAEAGSKSKALNDVKNVITGMVPSLKSAEGGVNGFSTSLKALLANPVVLVITGIVGALKFVYEAFQSNVKIGKEIATVWAGLSGVGSQIVDSVMGLVRAFAYAAEAAYKFITLDFTGAAKAMKKANGEASTSFNQLKDAVDGTTFSILKGLEKQQQANNKAKKEQSVRQSEINKLLVQSREILTDETASIKDKKKALEEVTKAEKDSSKEKVRTAQVDLNILKSKAKALGGQAEVKMKQEIREATIALNEAETENAMTGIKLNKQRKMLLRQEVADGKEAAAAAKERAKEKAEADKAVLKSKQDTLDKIKKAENDAKKNAIDKENEFNQVVEDIANKNYENTLSQQEQELRIVEAKYFELETKAAENKDALNEIEIAKMNELNDINLKFQDTAYKLDKDAKDKKAALDKEAAAKEIAQAKAVAEQKAAIQMQGLETALQGVQLIKGLFEKQKGVQKAAVIAESAIGIAKMIISNKLANVAALATPQAVATSGAAAAPVIAMNNISTGIGIAANIAATAKALKTLGGGSAPSGGGAGGGGGTGGVMSANFNVVGNSGINQLAQLQQTPTKAYVVSSDVTSGQSLDRNRIENATLVQ
jgi:hypothetical protein